MAPFPLRKTTILLATALLFSRATAAITNDFSFYPKNAQSCLYSAANASGCAGDTNQEMNSCLCGNSGSNGFVSGSAACIGASDPDDVSSTFAVMEDSCKNSNTPIGLTIDQFKAAAAAAASTATDSASKTATKTGTGTKTSTSATTTPSVSQYVTTVSGTPQTVTVTSFPSATNTNSSSPSPPNNTAIIAGAAIGGAIFLLLIALAAFCIIRSRRRRAAGDDEAQHMLPQSGYGPFSGGDFAMQNTTAALGSGAQGDQKWRPPSGQSADWQQPPAASPQFNWDTPYDNQYGKSPAPSPGLGVQYSGGGYHQPPPVDQSGQLTPGFPPGHLQQGGAQGQTAYGAPPVFELQGAETPVSGQAPVEAPGSPVRPLRGAHNYPPPTWQQQ
jgi:hypothetical protein